MRFIVALFALLALVQAGRVREFVSSILGESPNEIRSQIMSDFSDFMTITATDSSVLASISSEIQSAIDNAVSTYSTEVTLTGVPTVTATSRKNDAPATSSYSGIAAFAALLMSVVFFQAL